MRACLLVAGLGAAAAAYGQDPQAPEAPEFTVNGLVSSSYSFNRNRPDSGLNGLRVFDFDDTKFKLDVAELVFQRTLPNVNDVGFRMDLTAGKSVPKVAAASGLFRDSDTGEAEDYDLQQAFVSWKAPVGSGLRLDFGKHVTHLGYEVIEGYDGWNDNFSRSFLFGYAIAFTHTGLKASYATEKASFTGLVVQGWDNVKDNNSGKSLGAQIVLTPSKPVSIYLNWMGGPEQADRSNRRDVLNAILVLKPTGTFTLAADYVYGREDEFAGPGTDAAWQALAAYLRINASETLGFTFRGEWFDDENGVRTGAVQTLKGLTFTPELKLTRGFALRGEVRYDHSNEPVFEKEGGQVKDSQTTAAVNALFSF
jgi:hypothetical protein